MNRQAKCLYKRPAEGMFSEPTSLETRKSGLRSVNAGEGPGPVAAACILFDVSHLTGR
jgi:hypothetical protein